MVTIPFNRNGFTEVVPANAPVKKTDEEKIVKALKLNRHLIMDDMVIIIMKTRKTVMGLLKKGEKKHSSVPIKWGTGKLKIDSPACYNA